MSEDGPGLARSAALGVWSAVARYHVLGVFMPMARYAGTIFTLADGGILAKPSPEMVSTVPSSAP
jgi:hypothetical protein